MHPLVDLIAPPRCLACAGPIPAGSTREVCAGCRAEFVWLPEPRCPRCALDAHGAGAICPAGTASFAAAWAPLAHDGTGRALVAALKFRGRIGAADVMAAQLAATAPPGLLVGGATLVPVPAHPRRRRARGIDHARLIAERLGRRTRLPVRRCLVRRDPRAGGRAGVSRRERLRAGPRVEARGRVPPVAVLVDDVHTTGTTLDTCAAALLEAGALRVVAVTYTRAL